MIRVLLTNVYKTLIGDKLFRKLNFWSFILSLVCFILLILFSIFYFESYIAENETHPLEYILYLTFAAFILSILGICGVSNWKTVIRSFFTVIFSLGLLIFLEVVLFFGKWLHGDLAVMLFI